ncbi:perlucin-like protein [Saccostrea echinata]|uniref:perlucin-like protein n=1 Tax=Saccostrea echinata TaxID=191078 RepID=UPI002A8046EF|nr:perlucin-like protein [Saccostrea echinata]
MLCKLLKIHLNKNVVTELYDGWKFFYDTKACDSGWTPFNGHCYYIGNTLISWSNSQIQCQNYGAYVLEIESVEENMWIIETFLPRNESDCSEWRYCTVWVGATDRDIEGTFTWIRNKKELTYLPWGNGQPDDKKGQDCIRLSPSGKWIDANCGDNNQINYVCERN